MGLNRSFLMVDQGIQTIMIRFRAIHEFLVAIGLSELAKCLANAFLTQIRSRKAITTVVHVVEGENVKIISLNVDISRCFREIEEFMYLVGPNPVRDPSRLSSLRSVITNSVNSYLRTTLDPLQ